MPNSENDSRAAFFELFRRLWSDGEGRHNRAARPGPWVQNVFMDRMNEEMRALGHPDANVDSGTVRSWRGVGRKPAHLPQSTRLEAILHVFFPGVEDGKDRVPPSVAWKKLRLSFR